jgi:hypothetical protein
VKEEVVVGHLLMDYYKMYHGVFMLDLDLHLLLHQVNVMLLYLIELIVVLLELINNNVNKKAVVGIHHSWVVHHGVITNKDTHVKST